MEQIIVPAVAAASKDQRELPAIFAEPLCFDPALAQPDAPGLVVAKTSAIAPGAILAVIICPL